MLTFMSFVLFLGDAIAFVEIMMVNLDWVNNGVGCGFLLGLYSNTLTTSSFVALSDIVNYATLCLNSCFLCCFWML